MKRNLAFLVLSVLIMGCSPAEFTAMEQSSKAAAGGALGNGGDDPVGNGGPVSGGDPASAVDTFCDSAGSADIAKTAVLLPYVALGAPSLPASCQNGFEVNNMQESGIALTGNATQSRKLVVDIATYTAHDTIKISAENSAGAAKTLVHVCRVRTAEYADPTNGTYRPFEDTVRRWEVTLPAGTTKLVVDNSLATTPTYIRVLGLCDFNTNISSGLPANHYRQVAGAQ